MTNSPMLLEIIRTSIQAVSESARSVEIEPETRLVEDLSLDSLDMVAVFIQIQDVHEVEFDLDAVLTFHRVDDLMRELDRHLAEQVTAA